VLDDPNYNLRIKQTLTIKPNDFFMRAISRDGLTPTQLEHRLAGNEAPSKQEHAGSSAAPASGPKGTERKITILYGSNSGTCESLAQRVATEATSHGFIASTVDCLDTANGSLPKDEPVVIITASYEGQPPDNAGHFVSWIESIKGKDALKGVSYAVFGCGHHDWAQTFHRIPKLLDGKLEECGAQRIVPIGLSDAANGDIFSDFETWEDDVLWPALKKQWDTSDVVKSAAPVADLNVTVTNLRTKSLRQDVREALVVDTRLLTAKGEPVKKHVELKLPSDVSYRAGDYIAILPFNPKESIRRAMKLMNLPWDSYITINTHGKTLMPTNQPISAWDVFSAYVELAQPATKRVSCP
jgi:cytochrome P450 / NADPH-cytochrome P450 reductase